MKTIKPKKERFEIKVDDDIKDMDIFFKQQIWQTQKEIVKLKEALAFEEKWLAIYKKTLTMLES